MEVQLVHLPFCPMASNLAATYAGAASLNRSAVWGEWGGWHRLEMLSGTVWGSILCTQLLNLYWLPLLLQRIPFLPSRLWTLFISYLFLLKSFTVEKAPRMSGRKRKDIKFHFAKEKSSNILQYFSFKSLISPSPAAFISLIHKGTLSWIYKQNPLIKSNCFGDWSRRFGILCVFFSDIH